MCSISMQNNFTLLWESISRDKFFISFFAYFYPFLSLIFYFTLFFILFEKSSNDWPGHSTELLAERSLFSLVPRKVRTTREIGERAPAAVSPAAIAMLRSAHYLRLQPSSSRKEGNSGWQRRISREFNPKCRKIRSRLPAAYHFAGKRRLDEVLF